MDQPLQNLIRRLQDEKCPPAVLARVRERLSREPRPSPLRAGIVAWVLAAVVLFGTVVLWPWQARREARRLAAEEKSRRELVVQQTHAALGYIGHALIRAATRTEDALTKQAVPPIRDSFEVIKNKLPKPI